MTRDAAEVPDDPFAVLVPSPASGPMTSADLAIRSRRILTTTGWLDGWIEIREGRVSQLRAADDEGAEEALNTGASIDALDRVVVPGLVDTHAHLRDPGFTQKEDWTTGTRAAAAGGVTTIVDMPNVQPPPNTVERFLAHRENAARKSLIDFGHHASAAIPEEIAGMAAAGATAFKLFMMRDVKRDYPHMPGIAVDDHATLYRIAEEVAKTGLPLLVHPNDQAIHELLMERWMEREGRDFRSYARANRDGEGVVLDGGIAVMLAIQRATGVRLHVLHVSTIGGWSMIRAAKAEGRPVTAEVNPFHLFVVNDWANIERWGPYALGMWVPEAHAEATWEAVLDGTADVIGSDHTPHAREEKVNGWEDMYATPGGSPTIQHYLSLLLTAAHEGRISLERIVELCAANPARLLGIEGRKGVIEPGADADLLVLDTERRHTIREADVLSKCGWTVLDGREVVGVPELVLQRGRVIVRDGAVLAEPGEGRPLTSPVPA